MKIESSAFEREGKIPAKYTCDGENISPPLVFSGIPSGVESLVLIMDDPDLPPTVLGGRFTHWLVWNIPPGSAGIGEGGPVPGVEGKNSSGVFGYAGSCPPKEHRYFFKLYALDTELELNPDTLTQNDLAAAMGGHILAEAELMGRYDRPR